MGTDNQAAGASLPEEGAYQERAQRPGRSLANWLAVLALAIVSVSAATGFLRWRWLRTPEGVLPPTTPSLDDKPVVSHHFRDWPENKPDLVLLLTGQEYGYLLPCGCSSPQYGGLERRYNFLQELLQRGWPVVALDVGDVPQHQAPQTLLKYGVAMQARKLMGYAAVGIGQREMELPLLDALAQFALNSPTPRILAANLLNKETNFPNMVGSWKVIEGKGTTPHVGVVGLVGNSVADLVRDPAIKFGPGNEVLKDSIKKMQAQQEEAAGAGGPGKGKPPRPEFLVLLYQGSLEQAKICAKMFPQVNVILSWSDTEDPPSYPVRVGETFIIQAGHKGKNVGVLGAFRTGNPQRPFDLHYQVVAMGPEYATPAEKEKDNPILALMEEYTQEVKRDNYLARYAQTEHPLQLIPEFNEATYVGSAKCKKCHEHAYEVWENSRHAQAYASLEKARKPSLRQFDGECIKCHVVGFDYQSGYRNETATAHLKNVGCESCHGPASLHVKDPNNVALREKMNPFKTPEKETAQAKEKRLNRLDQSCTKCHDTDNDAHWKNVLDKWKEIDHRTPKE